MNTLVANKFYILLTCLFCVNFITFNTFSEGNLTKRAKRLNEIIIDGNNGLSINKINIETGKFYRLRITSDGKDEYIFEAPIFFRNIWIDQIVIDKKEIKPTGIYFLEYDDKGSIDLFFIALRTGSYNYGIRGYPEKKFKGQIIIK
ncbi:MAG: hypothetical protein ACI914_001143 [Candidatus Marivariicella framensis]|jgi:hypothetical protein|tara:strand:+ start:39 stop:476 length:438 start_codon:yes stop_codon:yes gene_type:complete